MPIDGTTVIGSFTSRLTCWYGKNQIILIFFKLKENSRRYLCERLEISTWCVFCFVSNMISHPIIYIYIYVVYSSSVLGGRGEHVPPYHPSPLDPLLGEGEVEWNLNSPPKLEGGQSYHPEPTNLCNVSLVQNTVPLRSVIPTYLPAKA